jgi:hypothetical protein
VKIAIGPHHGLVGTTYKIRLTEDHGFRWFPWTPPHEIRKLTIDEPLHSLEEHLAKMHAGASPTDQDSTKRD